MTSLDDMQQRQEDEYSFRFPDCSVEGIYKRALFHVPERYCARLLVKAWRREQ
jgi:hypothetical protein